MSSALDHGTAEAAVLRAADWRARRDRHAARADALTAAYRRRRAAGERHPVEDFLFTYYSHAPAKLRRWHPGAGAVLEGADPADDGGRWYRAATPERDGAAGAVLDTEAFRAKKGSTIGFVLGLLRAVQGRPAHLGCFGLHEWAMVYKLGQDEVRHSSVPLRLGQEGTDAVVEAHPVRCSHFDAYRFFTDAARPLNRLRPTRESQPAMDQPGCLHANMDLYKWSYKLSPLVPSELVADCFELARDVRALDMRASPYDLADYGYPPVRIETPEGKAAYIAAQRTFADRARSLRERLIGVLSPHEPAGPAPDQ